MELAVCHY